MNEAETRAEHIDPALQAAGWGVVEGSRIRREYPITLGRLEGFGRRGKCLSADYVLIYRNTKLAVVEAKAWDEELTEGVDVCDGRQSAIGEGPVLALGYRPPDPAIAVLLRCVEGLLVEPERLLEIVLGEEADFEAHARQYGRKSFPSLEERRSRRGCARGSSGADRAGESYSAAR